MADPTPIFNDAASMFNMDPILPQAVARVESGGLADPDRAVSSAGALGRMQIMPPNLQRMNVRDPSDPHQNIYAGTSLLDEALTASNGNVPLALRIYQGGPNQSKWGSQNAAYPGKVAAAYQQIVREQAQAGAQSPPPPAAGSSPSSTTQQPASDGVDAFLSGVDRPSLPAAAPTGAPAVAAAVPSAAPARDQTDDFLSGAAPIPTSGPATPTAAASPPTSTVVPVVGLPQGGQLPVPSRPSTSPDQPPPPPPPASPTPDQTPGVLQSFGAGLYHGGQSVADTLNRGAAYVDSQVPVLAKLDAFFGKNPQAAVDAQPAAEAAYQQKYGDSWAASAGNLTGKVAASTPFLMTGAGALGTAGRVVAGELPEVASALSGAANANMLARGAVGVGKNALTGASMATLTGDDPLAGAAANIIGAPIVKYIAAPAVAAGVGAIRNALTGSVERAIPPAGAFGSPAPAALPISGEFLRNPLAPGLSARELQASAANSAAPSEPIPNAPPVAQANSLLQPVGKVPFDIQLNPAGEAAPSSGPNAPTTAAEAAAVPDSLPRQVLPLMTQADYEKRADAIIQHFATGGRQALSDPAIPGSPKTLAQSTGNAGIATLERGLRGVAPNEFAAVDDGAKQAQQSLLARITGSNGDYENAVAARDASTSGLRTAAFSNTQPVDAQPFLNQVDDLIAKNAGRPSVQQPLQTYRSELEKIAKPDGNGAAMVDPRNLDNARLFLGDMVSPLARGTANDGQAASAQLLSLKPALHDLIESGAPGFKNYIQAFSDQSGPINGMQYLQTRNLTDLQGNPQLSAVDKTLKDIAKTQTFGRGAQHANGVTPDQVEALGALRDDLLQSRNSLRGKALGSDTASNLATSSTINALANPLAKGAARIGGALSGGLGGYAAGEGANAVVANAQAKAEAGVRAALIERLLNRNGKGVAALSVPAAPAPPLNLLAGTAPRARIEPRF